MSLLGACKCCKGKVSDEAKHCPHCGQPAPFDSDELIKIARDYLRRDQKVDAMKYVFERTGWSIKEAKDFVLSL
jgi:ribosomal protein L7/L12